MLNLIQIHLRTHRFFLLAWLTPLVLLAATSPGTYISSYPDEGSLAAVGASMRGTLGPVVLYGTIPEPFNYATWTSWKTISWLIILAAIMNILLGSSVSRGLEESGQAELLQSNGLSAGVLRRAALTVTILTSVLWGVLVAVSLWANSALSDQFTLKGSLIDGGVSLMSVGFFGLLAILAGEAFGSVRAARQASLLVLLVSFGVRIVADVYDRPWLHWLTPFGWIRVVKPYQHDGNHWLPTMIFTAVLLLMSIPIIVVKRDLHSQWVQLRPRKYRAAGWGPWSLWWRLQGPVIVWWAVAIIFVSTGFFAMTGEMNSVIENSPGTAELAAQMVPDLQNAYAYMSGIIVGLIVCCMAIQLVLAGHKAEKQGLVTLILTTEQRRPMLFLQNFLYTMIATIMTLIPAAFLSAYAAIADSNVSDDQFSTVVWAIIDLIAPVVACCGIAALCLAIRTGIIAWLVVAASGFLSFFGSLLKLDKWVLDLSVFAWAPHTVDHYRGAIALLAIGLGSLLAGAVIFTKRDIVT
ncbi:hypothetical protein [Corynebacterium matruchotii]|uniref:hypothetical protein n=1 Tax=Corynebacterium matruchotii TaxID=43768 RepID=UPI0028ED0201|nr:hypothetical protein [Corynebacterium matruchotii]